jgi:hypothetical protein
MGAFVSHEFSVKTSIRAYPQNSPDSNRGLSVTKSR